MLAKRNIKDIRFKNRAWGGYRHVRTKRQFFSDDGRKGINGFFDSGGLSCRLLYRTSGLDGSIHLLLQLVREIFPIIRLNIVSGSSDLRVFVPIADTLPNGLTRVREAGKGRKSYPIIAHGSDLSKPLLLNDLESFKREALKIDPVRYPSCRSIPMRRCCAFRCSRADRSHS